jgi:hypothetical protein
MRWKYTLLTVFLAHASLDSTVNRTSRVLSIGNCPVKHGNFIAPHGIQTDALV